MSSAAVIAGRSREPLHPHPEPRWVQVLSHIDSRFGGITSAVPALSQALTHAGIDISAAAFCGDDEKPQASWAVPPERFPLSRVQWLKARLLKNDLQHRLNRVVETAAGLHIHGLWQQHCSAAAAAARAMRKPYIVSAHGMLERWAVGNKSWKKRIYSALIENRNLSGAACLHALTVAEADDYRRAGFRNPVAIIPNGIHMPPHADPALFLQHFPQLREKKLVLFLSRIHFKKGLDVLTEAWTRVQAEIPDAHLVLAGPDFEGTKKVIQDRIAQLGITDRVTFTGMLSGELKWSALSAATVYTLPSYSEGFSVAILEAMAMEKPVIITRQCNFPEVAAAHCGWQIEPRKLDLEDALLAALTEPAAQLQSRGVRGRVLVADHYTWPQVASQLADTYRWTTGGEWPKHMKE